MIKPEYSSTSCVNLNCLFIDLKARIFENAKHFGEDFDQNRFDQSVAGIEAIPTSWGKFATDVRRKLDQKIGGSHVTRETATHNERRETVHDHMSPPKRDFVS
jgi:hypothetical protein